MMKITGEILPPSTPNMQDDIAATWSGIKGMADALQIICESQRVLVIADEVHHAALGAVWGDGTTHGPDRCQARRGADRHAFVTRGDGADPSGWTTRTRRRRPTTYKVP